MTLANPRERAERALGAAVHPRAIDRLFEVWPKAAIAVDRYRTRHDGLDLRVTRVQVQRSADEDPRTGTVVQRQARCHPNDQFERRAGIRIAFDRCLREVVRRVEPERLTTGRSER